jgi:DNA-binding MarR family transcriptional regulator
MDNDIPGSDVWPHLMDNPQVFRELMRVHQAFIQYCSQEFGLPPARLAVMRQLALAHPEGLGIMVLAKRLGVTPAAVSRHVGALEAEGLAARRSEGRDGRFRRALLTAQGLETFRSLHAASHALEEEVRSEVGKASLDVAARVLARIRGILEQKTKEQDGHAT